LPFLLDTLIHDQNPVKTHTSDKLAWQFPHPCLLR
jgi:hypothetical protein